MSVWLLSDRPDHTMLAAATAILAAETEVRVVDPAVATIADDEMADVDLALLKAHTPAAVTLARHLEAAGATVVNRPAATERVFDRSFLATMANRAKLPFPASVVEGTLGEITDSVVGYPVIVKSKYSRRHDLVTAVDDHRGLDALTAVWADENVVVQPRLAGDGWDHKVWVVGDSMFYGRRRSPLGDGDGDRDTDRDRDRDSVTDERPVGELGDDVIAMVRRVGELFDLVVFGVDLLRTPSGPMIVDVNAFPGCRGVDGAAEALAEVVRLGLAARSRPAVAVAAKVRRP